MMHDYDELIARLKVSEKTSEPYYQQLKRNILTLIESGEIAHGHGLPSERMLAEALNLSRTTVRRCYEDLRASGQIDSDGRAGTLVKAAPKICPSLGKLKGFTEEMREVGITASAKIVSHQVMCDRTIASIFQRPSTSSFLRLVRIRLGDEVPMTREVAWYDLTLAPALANWDQSGSAYQYLEQQCGIQLSWAEQSIEAVMCNEEESRVFDFEQSSPCLLLKRKSYSQQQQLVEYVEGTFRGDAYTYRIKLEV